MLVRLFIISAFFLSSTTASAQSTTIYFDFDSYTLSKEARFILDNYVQVRNISALGIFGHTDQRGRDEYNEWLSVQRAKAVRDYLLQRGLSKSKIGIVRGYGAKRLITTEPDSLAMRLNRRVYIANNYKPLPGDSAIAAHHAALMEKRMNRDGTVIPPTVTEEPVARTTAPVQREEHVARKQVGEKLIEDIKDNNTRVGENIILKNINFHPGSHRFLESAQPALQDLLETMQKVPSLEIEIQGHVCCPDNTNEDGLDVETGVFNLSVSRAKAVYDFLVENGISELRLSYKGLASNYPLIKNEITEADRVANRRVEIKIMKK